MFSCFFSMICVVCGDFILRSVVRAIGLIRDLGKCYMSPLWGFREFGCPITINMPPLWG